LRFFIKKITQFLQKRAFLTKIFKVYEGKIAIFAISNQQIDAHSQFIEPVDVEIFAITGKIRNNEKLAAAGAVADVFHLRKRAQQVLAVFFTQVLGLGTHAAEDFDPRDDVVAVEPGRQGIFAAAKQDGAVAFFREDTVEIVYPERDTAPSEKRKRDKEAGTDDIDAPSNTGIDCRPVSRTIRKLGKVTEHLIPPNSKKVQRHKVPQELFALEAGFCVFPTENKKDHINNSDQADKPPVFKRRYHPYGFLNGCKNVSIVSQAGQKYKSPHGNHTQVKEHLPELRDESREHAHKSCEQNTERHEEIRDKVKVLVFFHKDKHRLVEVHIGTPTARAAALALEMQNVRDRRIVVMEPHFLCTETEIQVLAIHEVIFVKAVQLFVNVTTDAEERATDSIDFNHLVRIGERHVVAGKRLALREE